MPHRCDNIIREWLTLQTLSFNQNKTPLIIGSKQILSKWNMPFIKHLVI